MTQGLVSLVIAGLAFCGSHVLLSSTGLRGSLRDQLGERGFLAVYSLTAAATFAWFVVAYAHSPTIVLWPEHRWTALVPVVVMPLASILLVAGYTTPNPTAVTMERLARADDPAPGVLRVSRHPMMGGQPHRRQWRCAFFDFFRCVCRPLARRHRADRPQKTACPRQRLVAPRRNYIEHSLCRAGDRPRSHALARY